MKLVEYLEYLPTPSIGVGTYLLLSAISVFIGLLSLRGNPIKGG